MHKGVQICARAALVAAFAVTGLAVSAHAQEKVWRHGLLNAKSDAGIFMMMSTRDFAKKHGLKIEISQFKDDQLALKALIAGEIDSFEGGPQGVFAADARGADARIIGCHWVVVPHGIYANGSIKSVKDLQGKSIAVSSPNMMPDLLARAALEANGVPVNSVKFAAVGGDRERYQALIGGVVQAAVVSNEYQPIAPKSVHLLLAGHTHCGQGLLPIYGPVASVSRFKDRYRCGLVMDPGLAVVVTGGLGTSGPPLRPPGSRRARNPHGASSAASRSWTGACASGTREGDSSSANRRSRSTISA